MVNGKTISSAKIRLPEVKLPQFDGTPTSWTNFISLFNENVHTNAEIPEAVKMQYLKSNLKGDDTKLVSHITPTADNYQTSYDILQRRYNNKREMLSKLLNPIIDIPFQNYENYSQLQQMHDVAYECINAIKNLDILIY